MGAALAYAIQLLTEVPALISAGVQVGGLITSGTASLKAMQAANRAPTDQEWADLNKTIADLRAQLHAP